MAMPGPSQLRADFFDGLGEAIGRVLRAIVDGLAAFIGALWHTVGRFLRGLAHGLGVNDSFFSLALVAVGLLLLWAALRAAARLTN